ncbi:MAG: metal-sulfur cluster assembly factor [Candidatus Micrarchaeota archaeon]
MVTKKEVLNALKHVMDPELGVDIVSLGLIYDVLIEKTVQTSRKGGKNENTKNVHVKMTFTTPACPLLSYILSDCEEKTKKLKGVKDVVVEVVWEPRWTPDLMSEEAKIKLGMV